MRVTRRGFLAAGPAAGVAGAAAPAEWKAGVARVDVTPAEPIWMAGYASRNKPSEGVKTPLFVKALALEDGAGKPAVIVGSDIIGFRRELAEQIAEACQREYGLPRERLVLNSSHTHSGPVIGGRPGYGSMNDAQVKVVQRYTESLREKVIAVVGQAIRGLAPAKLEFRYGLAGFAVNRRRDRPGTRGLPGPVDHDVPVLSVRGADGRLRAVVFGYSCHNTTLGAYDINADYAGYAQTALEKVYPEATALFLEGCGADSNPLPRYHGTDAALTPYSVELATMYGKILATAVDLVLHDKMRPLSGPLTAVFERIEIPFQPTPTREMLEAMRKDQDATRRSVAERLRKALDRDGKVPASYSYPIQVLRFGDGLKLIALGGEVVVDYSLRLKALLGWEDTWVAGYSNDVFGYVPSLRVLKEGGYEAQGGAGGLFGAAVEETIVERVQHLVERAARSRSI